MRGLGHEDIIHRRLDDVAQAIQREQAVGFISPGLRGLEGQFRAGVDDGAGEVAGGGAAAIGFAVISGPASGARGEIQPAEESLRQSDLMYGIGPRGVGEKRGTIPAPPVDNLGITRKTLPHKIWTGRPKRGRRACPAALGTSVSPRRILVDSNLAFC